MEQCLVLIVERRRLFREGLGRIISNSHFEVAAVVPTVRDLSVVSCSSDRPLLLILGARENPIATATEIATFRQQFAHGRIVVLADSHNPDEATLAFRAGAHGYLAKIDCHKDLLASLELVMKGETIMRSLSPPLAMYKPLRLNNGPYSEHSSNDDDLDSGRMSDRADDGEAPRFSSREKVILRYLVAGAPNKLIAREIGTAESTVKVHVKAILRKARVLNRTQAAIWAARNYKLLALDAESERLGRSREIDAA